MILSASNFLDCMVSTMCRPRPLRASHQLVRALYSIRAKVRSLKVDVGAVASTGADVAPMVAASVDDGDGDCDDDDPDPGCHLTGLPAHIMRFPVTLSAGMAS